MPDDTRRPGDRAALYLAIGRLIEARQRVALITFNLSRFRDINIDMGHAVGDRVLQEIATRVTGVLRGDDRLFHIGNDEFAVLLIDIRSPQLAELAAGRILAVIGENFCIAERIFSVSACAGIAVYPEQVASRDELMRAGDAALQQARRGSGGYRVFNAALKAEGQLCSELKGLLKSALDGNLLQMHYQPQVDLQGGALSGCEALVRWQDAERGWISPEIFIPIAESSALIDDLTYWSINVALREWFEYCSRCSQAATISVNLSARLLHSPEIVDLVLRAMNIWGVAPGCLLLEVTESAMMSEPAAALRTLTMLNDLGVRLSIDDFGTGYSSLAYLKKLPISELKIEKSFVQAMASDKQDRKIVQAVIDLAHNLDLKVVAEGVENRLTMNMLTEMGCDIAQGFYIAQPMRIVELSGWVDASPWQLPVLQETSRA